MRFVLSFFSLFRHLDLDLHQDADHTFRVRSGLLDIEGFLLVLLLRLLLGSRAGRSLTQAEDPTDLADARSDRAPAAAQAAEAFRHRRHGSAFSL